MKPIYGTFLSDPKGTFKIKKMAHYFYFLDAVQDYRVCYYKSLKKGGSFVQFRLIQGGTDETERIPNYAYVTPIRYPSSDIFKYIYYVYTCVLVSVFREGGIPG